MRRYSSATIRSSGARVANTSMPCSLPLRRIDPAMASSSGGSPATTLFASSSGHRQAPLRAPRRSGVTSATGSNEQGYWLAGLRERADHVFADPTRSENRISLRTPLQIFAPHSIQPPQGPKECDAQNGKYKGPQQRHGCYRKMKSPSIV
jgi:hypothetical protein